MFKKEQLIFVTLLAGCTTVANPPQEIIEPIEQVQVTAIEDTSLLDAIDSTLEGADAILNQIVENKVNTENKISNLQQTILEEEELINSLQSQCTKKDSLIENYITHHEIIHKKLETAEAELAAAVHKCTNECTPAIHNLVEENKYLKACMDSLIFQLNYADSLILTSKKLTKVYEAD